MRMMIVLAALVAMAGCEPILPFLGKNNLEASGTRNETNTDTTENNQLSVTFAGAGDLTQQTEALTEVIRARAEARAEVEVARARTLAASAQVAAAEARAEREVAEGYKWRDRFIWTATAGAVLLILFPGLWLWFSRRIQRLSEALWVSRGLMLPDQAKDADARLPRGAP